MSQDVVITGVKGEKDTKRHLCSCKSWSHWSDQINWPKTGKVEQDWSCSTRSCMLHHALSFPNGSFIMPMLSMEVSSWPCCPNGSRIMLKFNCWTFFQTNGIILFTQPIRQFNCFSLMWFETLLNNYKLGPVQKWHSQKYPPTPFFYVFKNSFPSTNFKSHAIKLQSLFGQIW